LQKHTWSKPPSGRWIKNGSHQAPAGWRSAASGPGNHIFTEEDWTDPNVKLPAYIRSKAVEEKTAWDFIAGVNSEMELSVINPVGIFGPVLG